MKKLAVIILCVLCNFVYVQAQKDLIITNPGRKPIPSKAIILPTTNLPNKVDVYEQPNFGGRMASYGNVADPFTYFFPNRRAISLKVAKNWVAYITFDDEHHSTLIFSGDYPNFGTVFKNDILSIRLQLETKQQIYFSGLSLEIHNNDCKKVQGTVKVRLVEKMSDGTYIPCPIIIENGRPITNFKTESSMFSKPAMEGAEGNGMKNFVSNFDGRTAPIVNGIVASNLPNISTVFSLSQYALSDGKIFLEVIPELTVAHKSGDFAGDYSSNVKILKRDVDFINIRDVPTLFSTKAFVAKGNPNDNHGQASGVDYSIIKHIRVHFKK